MAPGTIIAIAAALVGMLVGITTLAGLVWRMGALAADFKSSVLQLRLEVHDLKEMATELSKIPFLAQRVEQLEGVTKQATSYITELRIATGVQEEVRRSQGDYG